MPSALSFALRLPPLPDCDVRNARAKSVGGASVLRPSAWARQADRFAATSYHAAELWLQCHPACSGDTLRPCRRAFTTPALSLRESIVRNAPPDEGSAGRQSCTVPRMAALRTCRAAVALGITVCAAAVLLRLTSGPVLGRRGRAGGDRWRAVAACSHQGWVDGLQPGAAPDPLRSIRELAAKGVRCLDLDVLRRNASDKCPGAACLAVAHPSHAGTTLGRQLAPSLEAVLARASLSLGGTRSSPGVVTLEPKRLSPADELALATAAAAATQRSGGTLVVSVIARTVAGATRLLAAAAAADASNKHQQHPRLPLPLLTLALRDRPDDVDEDAVTICRGETVPGLSALWAFMPSVHWLSACSPGWQQRGRPASAADSSASPGENPEGGRAGDGAPQSPNAHALALRARPSGDGFWALARPGGPVRHLMPWVVASAADVCDIMRMAPRGAFTRQASPLELLAVSNDPAAIASAAVDPGTICGAGRP